MCLWVGIKGICDFCIRKASECQGKLDEKLLHLRHLKVCVQERLLLVSGLQGTEQLRNTIKACLKLFQTYSGYTSCL